MRSTKKEGITIICENSVDDTQIIEVGQFCFCLSWSLSPAFNSNRLRKAWICSQCTKKNQMQ
jgi:hypothetical protein